MKPKPELVIPVIADMAINDPNVKHIQDVYGSYVRLMRLRPGCDNKDLLEWIRINRPGAFEAEKPWRKLKGGEG